MATITSSSSGVNGQVITITANAETTTHIFVPAEIAGIELKVISGTARFEQTSADTESILAGTNVWFPWADGDVAISTSGVVYGASAVRVVATNSVVAYVRY